MLNGLKTNIQIPDANAIQSYGVALAEIAVRTSVVRKLQAKAGLQNVKIHDAQNSPYVVSGKVTGDVPNPKFISALGTVVYSNIIFNAGHIFNDAGIEDYWDDFRIDDCLIQVTQNKKILETEIQGRDGTVKEYIGMGDFQVNVVGRLNGAYKVNPKDKTRILKTILSAPQPLAITNWWLQNLDITDVVITGFDFGQTEGEYSTQYFTFSAVSDRQIEARIIG